MEDTLTLEDAMDELSSAEDFLDYFGVPYDPAVVHVNRLHILQRFHDYLAKQAPRMPEDEADARAVYTCWLTRAYADFVTSNAQAEKVFAVFQHQPNAEGGTTSFVSLDKVFRTE
ncbi:nitrogen fixation protein NifW [Nitrogeniibacter mangrovi]|uniref:Nitrogenase-stabilizing/protective protein NifW n=1 Tax=Nitrogeniibacter mangrovi TaxID=2016596 RepID=A0A6C1BA33_9RHOO|nr:nitrogenase-stabilizing/protective protein NifW [Nitrogeniibacter mangrovi]QID19548.1 nitrogen fixation protein NifW [Nitrogeniibacter mangrovi]